MDKNIDTIKLIRLSNGEDVIALYTNYSEEDHTVTLVEPMLCKKGRINGSWMTTLVPWLPIDLIVYNVATISAHDIMLIMEPTEIFIEEYKTAVEHYLDMIDENKPIERLYTKVLESFDFPDTQH